MMGIVRAADGWLGINCLTGQHWLDVCAMLGLPSTGSMQIAIMLGGPERGEFFEKAQPWLSERTVDEIVELEPGDAHSGVARQRRRDRAGLSAVPSIAGSSSMPAVTDWSFRRPGRPVPAVEDPGPAGSRPAPRLGPSAVRHHELVGCSIGAAPIRDMPFADVKVLDLTTFWAGAYLTCYLGAFGADIVKVESIQRPDGLRYSGAWAHEGERGTSAAGCGRRPTSNKRDITLDLTSDEGRDLVRRLVREADVVVENFSPRVIEQFGLDYESLVELKPDVILVRMPGFGLRGRGANTSVGRSTSSRRRAWPPSPVTPTARRASCRGPPTRSSGCTRASRCWPRSSTGAAPAKANSSRSRRSRSRRAWLPSR